MRYRIGNLTAWLSVDEQDEEGVAAFRAPDGMWMPLIASDSKRREELTAIARGVAERSGRDVYEVQFARMSWADPAEGGSTPGLTWAEELADKVVNGELDFVRRTIREYGEREVLALRVTAALCYRGGVTPSEALTRMESLLGGHVEGRLNGRPADG